MAWRETRGAARHFAVLFGCVALGVAALVSVGTFAANLDRTLTREARALTGGDSSSARRSRSIRPRARRSTSSRARARSRPRFARWWRWRARRRAGPRLLVELKAVERAYPLYGRVETTPSAPLDTLLADRDAVGGAVVEAPLLQRLGIAVGDPLVIGSAHFTVTGVLVREPDRAGGLVTLGPHVLVGADALERTGLLQIGSRVRYRTLTRLPVGMTARAVADDLARTIGDPAVRIAAFDESQPGLRRFFSQLATYLGLVGLASLLVGGVGIASTVATFLRRQLATIAILKCLGAGSRVLLATYLIQTLGLALLGSLIGAVLGVATQPLLVRALAPFAPFVLEVRWDIGTLARGLALGLLAALLCALWPLLAVRAVPPSLILRRDVDERGWRARRPWAAALPILAGLVALVVWQAGSLRLGGIFAGASLAALALLLGLSRALVRLARRLTARAWARVASGARRPRSPGRAHRASRGGRRARRDAPGRDRAARGEPGPAAGVRAEARRAVVLLHRRAAGPARAVQPARRRRERRCADGDAGRSGTTRRHRRHAGDPRAHRSTQARGAGEELVPDARVHADVGAGAASGERDHPRALVDRRRGRGAPARVGRRRRREVFRRRRRRDAHVRRAGRADRGAR